MSAKHYLIVNTETRTLVDSFASTAAFSELERRQKAGEANLICHNTTHPKCPRWVRDLFVYAPTEARATAGL